VLTSGYKKTTQTYMRICNLGRITRLARPSPSLCQSVCLLSSGS